MNHPFGYHWHCKMSIDDLFSKFKFLCVLSLFCCSNLTKVPNSVGNLTYLCWLKLSYTSIEKLPDSTCSLSNLQILKLNHCLNLKELPTNLHQLTNLHCLEFINTNIRKVPAHLGKLKNLQVLSSFYVDKITEFGIQQFWELNLHGSLTIGELQNIENPSDALEADLKNKTHLVELELQRGCNWGLCWCNRKPVDSTNAGDAIENLRPSKHLKKLSIRNFVGKQFPNWLLNNSLSNVVTLVLHKCESS